MKTPTTVLLVVIAALLAANLFVNLPAQEAKAQSHLKAPHVIQVEAGAAGDGTCPSDVTGDGVVNVLDLIDLLLDFGAECPGPQLVGVAFNVAGHPILVRIWSDGFAEYKVTLAGIPGWEPQVWTPLPANPNAPRSRPIAVTESTGSSGIPHIYRLWADGTVDGIRFGSDAKFVTTAVEGWITEPN